MGAGADADAPHCTRQEVRKGFTWGEVTIVPLLEEEEEDAASPPGFTLPVQPDDRLVIPFQNENLYAYIESAAGEKKVRPCVDFMVVGPADPHIDP